MAQKCPKIDIFNHFLAKIYRFAFWLPPNCWLRLFCFWLKVLAPHQCRIQASHWRRARASLSLKYYSSVRIKNENAAYRRNRPLLSRKPRPKVEKKCRSSSPNSFSNDWSPPKSARFPESDLPIDVSSRVMNHFSF